MMKRKFGKTSCVRNAEKDLVSNFPVPKTVSITMYFPNNMIMMKMGFTFDHILHILRKAYLEYLERKILELESALFLHIHIIFFDFSDSAFLNEFLISMLPTSS